MDYQKLNCYNWGFAQHGLACESAFATPQTPAALRAASSMGRQMLGDSVGHLALDEDYSRMRGQPRNHLPK